MKLANAPMKCAPGECYAYQNVAFSLIGNVLAATTGKDYGQELSRMVFKPLGMNDASIGLSGIESSARWARPHIRSRSGWTSLMPKPTYYRLPPAAGVNASAGVGMGYSFGDHQLEAVGAGGEKVDQLGGDQRVVAAAARGLGEHRRRHVDAGQVRAAVAQRGALLAQPGRALAALQLGEQLRIVRRQHLAAVHHHGGADDIVIQVDDKPVGAAHLREQVHDVGGEKRARRAGHPARQVGVPDDGHVAVRDGAAGLLGNALVVTPVFRDRGPAWEAGLTQGERGLRALAGTGRDGPADFSLVATQGPVCVYPFEPRDMLDHSPREPNLRLYCPPGEDLEQRGSRAAPRPNAEGLANATEPGTRVGPDMARDPLLVPTGTEIAAYWMTMMEGLRNGG